MDKPVVGVEPASSTTALPVSSGVASQSSAKPATKIPTLAIPADAKGVVREEYERIAKIIPPIHVNYDRATTALESICDITDDKCDKAWTEVAKHMAHAEDQTMGLAPMCPATSKEGKAFEAHLLEHQNYISARKKRLVARIDALLSDATAKSRWNAHKAAAAVPQPCLDYACNDW